MVVLGLSYPNGPHQLTTPLGFGTVIQTELLCMFCCLHVVTTILYCCSVLLIYYLFVFHMLSSLPPRYIIALVFFLVVIKKKTKENNYSTVYTTNMVTKPHIQTSIYVPCGFAGRRNLQYNLLGPIPVASLSS